MVGVLFFVAGFVFASFVEYWAHRFMHNNHLFGKIHRDHHVRNEGQGFRLEFIDYIKPSWPLMLAMFLLYFVGWAQWWVAGVGWFVGCLLYAAFSAYAHQLQHENPAKCFWMRMPLHYVHHKYNMWHYNFGLAVDWWDFVFRTYKPVAWRDDLDPALAQRGLLQIKWW